MEFGAAGALNGGELSWLARAIPVAISIAESWGRRDRVRGIVVEVMEVVG